MNYQDAHSELRNLLDYIDGNIDKVSEISAHLQERVYQLLIREIRAFDTQNGRMVAGSDFKRRILIVEDKIEKILNQKNYQEVITGFLNTFETIEQRNLKLQLTLNDLEVGIMKVKPARQIIYNQAKDALTSGLNPAYVKPLTLLLTQNVIGGASIEDGLALIDKWNKDELVTGKFTTTGTPTPNLQKYATQLARDSAYGVHRSFNNIVKEQYGLNRIIYVGGTVRDSRPICEYLVSLRRPIELTEIDELFKGKIPAAAMKFAEKKTKDGFLQGTIPGTTGENFCQVCGGYNCRHQAAAVR